jgi:beta-aspartyl-peptidase (threonine type)
LQAGAVPSSGAALLVHGGAWAIPDEALPAHRAGLHEAVAVGAKLLRSGAPALEAATETVAAMEASGAFDAGAGAMLNQQGEAELDAGVMDGATRDYGGVMAVRRLAHPVRVARRLLAAGAGEVRLLAGEGAERFADAEGFALVENDALVHPRERERFETLRRRAEEQGRDAAFLPGRHALDAGEPAPPVGGDTVGCVARDREGTLAAATSTGGTPFKPPGRVGDSPLPGSGYYATERAAAGATGWGEAIAAVLLSSRAVRLVAEGHPPEEAAAQSLRRMHALIQDGCGEGATGGLLVLGATGGAWAFTTPRMARAGWSEDGEAWVQV